MNKVERVFANRNLWWRTEGSRGSKFSDGGRGSKSLGFKKVRRRQVWKEKYFNHHPMYKRERVRALVTASSLDLTSANHKKQFDFTRSFWLQPTCPVDMETIVYWPIRRAGTVGFCRPRTAVLSSWVFGRHGRPRVHNKNRWEEGWDPKRFQFRLLTAGVSGLEAGPRCLATSFHLRRQHKVVYSIWRSPILGWKCIEARAGGERDNVVVIWPPPSATLLFDIHIDWRVIL